MSKSKIMAIVIAAVVVIAGVGVAVPILRNRIKPENETTTVMEAKTRASLEEESTTVAPESESTAVEQLTNEKGEVVTDSQGKPVTTVKAVKNTVKGAATTKASGNKNTTKKTTPKKSTGRNTDTGVWYVDMLGRGLNEMEQKAVLGYSYNSEGDYFYTDDKDCWQSGFGYNEIYDQAAGFSVMYIDKLRIRFDYDDLAWMIQLWKGQYGWVFVGSEIGVYTSDQFKTSEINASQLNHYECADESNWLNMKMDLYWDSDRNGSYDKLFTRPYTKYWWATGFKFGTLNRFTSPITELIMQARVTFKSSAMANLFTTGMKKAGFHSAASASNLSKDSIYQSGSDVYFRWYSVYSKTFTDVGSGTVDNPGGSDKPTTTTTTVQNTENPNPVPD